MLNAVAALVTQRNHRLRTFHTLRQEQRQMKEELTLF